MVKFIGKEDLVPDKAPEQWGFKPGTKLNEQMSVNAKKGTQVGEMSFDFVAEINSDAFASAFYERQRYEVAAGREMEPVLYTELYNEIRNADLPKLVDVYQVKEGGVVFEKVVEGSEVKLATVSSGNYGVPIEHWAAGVEYTKDMIVFNQTWNLPIVERSAGRAYNALLNDLHFGPIISYSYASKNITNTWTGVFYKDTPMPEKYLRAIEAAITASQQDATDVRSGPYILLINPGERFLFERALTTVPQQGTTAQSQAASLIRKVIAYNGWSGTRGKKVTTYPGVAAGTAYLCSLSHQEEDFQSWVKQDLERTDGDGDVSRFILEQSVWDTYRGMYVNPAAAIQKITLPTMSSGDAPPVAA